MKGECDPRPVFVSRKTAAELMEISVDTFDMWVRAGFVPRAQINRGQIVRWHWPTVEARLASPAEQQAHDPSIVTGRYVSPRRRAKA
jgi:phage terminase Nu1 subunit (DNA packaging protein)